MKVGIITHHYISNYGAFLQAYALQNAISSTFPDAEVSIINYINYKHWFINTLGWFRFYRKKENARSWFRKIKTPHTFTKERKRFLKQTRLCFTAGQINRMNFDCIVIGSDEVWNYNDSKSISKIKFSHGLDCKNIIAYAPSVGNADMGGVLPSYIVDGIKKFTYLSTRDASTERLIKKLTDINSTKVLDPTFLFDVPKTKNPCSKKPYILFYYCDKLPQKYLEIILHYAKENGFAVYGAGECNKYYEDITVNITPFEWVQMFHDASFVFTGTFHGAVFSILNSKQFACYLTNASRIKKVSSLLDDFKIYDRVITDTFDIDFIMSNSIDYDIVYNEINRGREQSIGFIKKSIQNECNFK